MEYLSLFSAMVALSSQHFKFPPSAALTAQVTADWSTSGQGVAGYILLPALNYYRLYRMDQTEFTHHKNIYERAYENSYDSVASVQLYGFGI